MMVAIAPLNFIWLAWLQVKCKHSELDDLNCGSVIYLP